MQNKKGQGFTEFLVSKCQVLRALQANLSNQLLNGHPSEQEHPEFIRQVIRIQEHLPSCEWLLTALPELSNDENHWMPAIRVEMAKLHERMGNNLAIIRARPGTLAANLANESVSVLLELHTELENFTEDESTWFIGADVAMAA